jgi:molecular chaperone GrpE (heat shock protein)
MIVSITHEELAQKLRSIHNRVCERVGKYEDQRVHDILQELFNVADNLRSGFLRVTELTNRTERGSR